MRRPAALLCLALLLAPPLARAADADAVAKAQTHYRAGKTLYDLGNYEGAIREFAAGYSLVPRPEFLLNLGQAYRRGGDLPKAKEMYLRYLEKAPESAPERPGVHETLQELEAELRAQPPPASDRPEASTLVPKAPVTEPAAQIEAEKPFNHAVWAVPVAVAVAVGVGVAIFFATRPPDACGTAGGLGCFDLRPR